MEKFACYLVFLFLGFSAFAQNKLASVEDVKFYKDIEVVLSTTDTIVLKNYTVHLFGDDYVIEGFNAQLNGAVFGIRYYNNITSGYISTADHREFMLYTQNDKVIVQQDFHQQEDQENNKLFAEKMKVQTSTLGVDSSLFFVDVISPYADNTAWNLLESKPGSKNLIYLDMDGEASLPGWTTSYGDSKLPDFVKKLVWQVQANTFAAFDVNVTTNRTLFDAHPLINKTWCVIGESSEPFGGQSKGLSWGTSTPCVVDFDISYLTSKLNSAKNYYSMSLAVPSHELGHNLGLGHDGKSGGGDYYDGHGEWSPCMGHPLYYSISTKERRTVAQWSKGEYAGATNTYHNDMQMMAAILGYRTDDYVANTNIVLNGNIVNPSQNNGFITNSLDSDAWSFSLSNTGRVQLNAHPITNLGPMDFAIKILNANNTVIYRSNPEAKRDAFVDTVLPAGNYAFVVEAGYEKDASSGWTTYSTFGYYEISGSIETYFVNAFEVELTKIDLPNCNSSTAIVPTVQVNNWGTSTINSILFDIYVDDQWHSLQSFTNEYILSSVSKTFALNALPLSGKHKVKIVASLPNQQENNVANNELSLTQFFKLGEEHEFTTNYPNLPINKDVLWELKNNISNKIVQSSSTAPNTIFQNKYSQKFCIEKDTCYSLLVSGAFNLCVNENAADYKTNTAYLLGDEVNYNGKIYRANYWVNTAPPGAAWSEIKSCSGNYELSVENKSANNLLFTYQNTFVSPSTTLICASQTVAINEVKKSVFSIYPNPVSTMLSISFSEPFIGEIIVLNSIGSIVQKEFCDNQQLFSLLLLPALDDGIYFMKAGDNVKKIVLAR